MDHALDEALGRFYTNNCIIPDLITEKYEGPTKVIDSRLYQLHKKANEWLSQYTDHERDILTRILADYKYLTQDKMLETWQSMLDSLGAYLRERDIEWSELLFVTTESSKGVISGAHRTYADIFQLCMQHNITSDQMISSIEKQDKRYLLRGIKLVVFVDDVAATGITMKNTMDYFIKHSRIRPKHSATVEFLWTCAVFTSDGRRHITNKMKEEFPYIKLTQLQGTGRHIKDVVKQHSVENTEKGVLEKIETESTDDKNYVMGYRRCKLAVSTYYDTPNNTLASFWSESEKNNPIFKRTKRQVTLADCRQKKNLMKEIAYFARSLAKRFLG